MIFSVISDMSTPKKIAKALERVKSVTDARAANIVKSSEISRADRELLTRTQWLQEIIKGWYMLARPDVSTGDSAAWYANFWDFLKVYLFERFGKNYCLSAEASLELQVGSSTIPKQIIVITSIGGSLQSLPFETSILTYTDPDNLPDEREEILGLQIMPLPVALCKVTPTYFRNSAENAEIALRSVRTPSDLTRVIVQYGFHRAAERIIGAYKFFGLDSQASEIQKTLADVGILVKPSNPFEKNVSFLQGERFRSPYAARIEILWNKYRNTIIEMFAETPSNLLSPIEYLEQINNLYEYDAYNSLSIEGYQVTPDLIKRVKENNWNPIMNNDDEQERNALAARGYYEAFQRVKYSVERILSKKISPGNCIAEDLSTWYQHLFAPSVRVGLVPQSSLIGYRNDRVFIRNSRHAPPPKDAVLDAMEAFFKCLQNENNATVRAVLGHYIFVFIHPYMDGNGRIARFILNAMLASGGYVWTIVEMSRRSEYINALETAHTEGDIEPFVKFILKEMSVSEGIIEDLRN